MTAEPLYVASIVNPDSGEFLVLSVHWSEDDAKQRCRDLVAEDPDEYDGFLFNVQRAENVDGLVMAVGR